jgi:putative peptidoglycan lipid II flippase
MYLVLGTYSLGLPASGITRQLNTVFYATGRTAVPARVGVERVLVSAALGGALAFLLDRHEVAAVVPGADKQLFLGAVGLAAGAAIGAWFELARIHRRLAMEGMAIALPAEALVRMVCAALLAAVPAAALWYVLPGDWALRALAPLVIGVYAVTYLGLAVRLGVSELAAWTGGLGRRSS